MRTNLLRFALCSLFCLTASACSSSSSANEENVPDAGHSALADASGHHGQDASQPDGDSDASSGESADAGEKPLDPETIAHLQACYVPAEWRSDAFDEGTSYSTSSLGSDGSGEDAGYEFLAADAFEGGYFQQLWIELYPRSPETVLTGSFDLAAEDFSYATCERCVLIAAGISETETKYFLAESGTLELTEVTAAKIAGALIDVALVEVSIAEDLTTAPVEGGCTTHIARLDFNHAPPELPEHLAACFVPERFSSQAFGDYIYELTANEKREEFFYRAMEIPAVGSGMPSMTLYIEVWRGGTGEFDLAISDDHNVLIESVMPNGQAKGYLASSGTLNLTALSETLMEGWLEDVHLDAAEITEEDIFRPIEGDVCSTELPSLAFSSADATIL